MKRILQLIFLLFWAIPAWAQSTSVTLQVTDASAQSWNNGTYSVFLTVPGGVQVPSQFFIAGTATIVPNQVQSGTLSGSGGASLTLTPDASIAPAGSVWKFTVCAGISYASPAPPGGPPCFTQSVTIVGASQNVTLAPPTPSFGPGSIFGSGVPPGTWSCNNTQYTDTSTGNLYTCLGAAWHLAGGSGTGLPFSSAVAGGTATVGNASLASFAWTFSLSGGTNPVQTASNNLMSWNVPLQSPSFTATGLGAAYTEWTTSAIGTSSAGTVRCGANTGNIFSCSDNAGTVTALPFIANDLGGTQTAPQVVGTHLAAEGYTGTQALTFTCANDTVTGTTNNLLAKQTSTGCIKIATTDTNVPVYIVLNGGTNSGNSHVAYGGIVPCVMDATTSNTQGFYVIASTGTGGRCHAQSAQPSGIYIVGVMLDNSTTSGSNGNVQVGGPYGLPAGGLSLTTSNVGGFMAPMGRYEGATQGGFGPIASANVVFVDQFVLPFSITVNKVTVSVTTSSASNHTGAGIYSSNGNTKLIDTGALSTTSTGVQTVTLGSAVALTAGVYYSACTMDNTTATLAGFNTTSALENIANGPIATFGTAANASVAGALPSTLGAVSANTAQNPCAIWLSP